MAPPVEDDEKYIVEALIGVLRDAGERFEDWKNELGEEVVADLLALQIDLGEEDDDPLMKAWVIERGGREVGQVHEFYYGSYKAWCETPNGPIKIGTFPAYQPAYQALLEALEALTEPSAAR